MPTTPLTVALAEKTGGQEHARNEPIVSAILRIMSLGTCNDSITFEIEAGRARRNAARLPFSVLRIETAREDAVTDFEMDRHDEARMRGIVARDAQRRRVASVRESRRIERRRDRAAVV